MTNEQYRYAYRRRSDGCDDYWVVVDTKTKKDLVYSVFWEDDPDWMQRSEARILLIVDALNAYRPARRRRAKP